MTVTSLSVGIKLGSPVKVFTKSLDPVLGHNLTP